MKKNGGGSIVFVNSNTAYRAIPDRIAYEASKGGQLGMMRALSDGVSDASLLDMVGLEPYRGNAIARARHRSAFGFAHLPKRQPTRDGDDRERAREFYDGRVLQRGIVRSVRAVLQRGVVHLAADALACAADLTCAADDYYTIKAGFMLYLYSLKHKVPAMGTAI